MAFECYLHGPREVYIISSRGGTATRVTHFGAETKVVCWDPSGLAVVVCSDGRQHQADYVELFSVPLVFGTRGKVSFQQPTSMGFGHADHLVFHKNTDKRKTFIVGRHTGDPAIMEWKGYRGGRAGMLWLTRDGGEHFELLDTQPLVSIGRPIYLCEDFYLLEAEDECGKSSNIYRMEFDQKQPINVTAKRADDIFYARNAHTDGRDMVLD